MKKAKRLDQYKGKLNPDQIAEGINAAIRNAKRLLEDANHLLELGRYPSAISIAVLAIEESGKVTILRELALARDQKEISDCWRAYRSHTKKNFMWLLPQLFAQGARKLDDFRPLFDEKSEHPYLLDQVKQIGFYTDCLGNANWSMPEEIIDEDFANSILSIAKVLVNKEEITPKEIELWKKHLGPVWKHSIEEIEQALENWYGEMQEVGLASEGDNRMKEFIKQGIG